jgi:hypothetical protein
MGVRREGWRTGRPCGSFGSRGSRVLRTSVFPAAAGAEPCATVVVGRPRLVTLAIPAARTTRATRCGPTWMPWSFARALVIRGSRPAAGLLGDREDARFPLASRILRRWRCSSSRSAEGRGCVGGMRTWSLGLPPERFVPSTEPGQVQEFVAPDVGRRCYAP